MPSLHMIGLYSINKHLSMSHVQRQIYQPNAPSRMRSQGGFYMKTDIITIKGDLSGSEQIGLLLSAC